MCFWGYEFTKWYFSLYIFAFLNATSMLNLKKIHDIRKKFDMMKYSTGLPAPASAGRNKKMPDRADGWKDEA